MIRTPIKDLKSGPIDQTFLVVKAERPQTKQGKTYLRMRLSDSSGSVAGIDWDPTPGRLGIDAGSVVRVVGSYTVDPKYGSQIKIRGLGKPLLPGEYDEADFAMSSPNDMGLVRAHFDALLAYTDPALVSVVSEALAVGGPWEAFWTAPAATTMHQGYQYGLFEHSVHVASIAFNVARDWCHEANQNVLVVAGLLHDIGKIVEYSDPLTRQLTTEGKLFGNTHLSASLVSELFTQNNMGSEDPVLKNIVHCILAHHGRKEWGSPVLPQTIEAVLIHQADQMSAKIGGYQRLLRDADSGAEWSARDVMFDGAMWLNASCHGDEEE